MSAKRMIGPFELESQLGVGGMGIVYLGTHKTSRQQAAIKVLTPAMSANPPLVARFDREMEILKKLQHPHIIRYYGGGKDSNGQHFYVMELMGGGSLEDVLKKKKKLNWEEAIDVGMQVAKALEYAHQHGIIHRDLKPANLFRTKAGKIKLGDFGIARDTEATALTAAGKTVGTYAYMAPEQITGKPPVSGKTDQYALGCVLFETLTGRTPFDGSTPAEMLFSHMQDEPPRVSQFAMDCPNPLEQVVARLLEKDPDDRYYDALAVQVALEEVGQKVAAQASIIKQTVEGGPTSTVATAADQGMLAKLLGKKKKKKKKFVPVWERGWFLGVSLAVLIAVVTWLVWPMSEAKLYAKAETLMQSEDPVEWIKARDHYLKPLVSKFPDGQFAAKAQEHLDFIEADTLRRQMETRRNKDPRSEAERLYREAREFENFGDRITALEKYRAMIEVLKSRDEDRGFVTLARQQVKKLEESGVDALDRVEIVNACLRDADTLALGGKEFEAKRKWESVVTLYKTNKEFEPHVAYAQARLDKKTPEPLDLSPRQKPTENK
jgi:serine/threonine-protein kinase